MTAAPGFQHRRGAVQPGAAAGQRRVQPVPGGRGGGQADAQVRLPRQPRGPGLVHQRGTGGRCTMYIFVSIYELKQFLLILVS